ncbi:ABC transporter permease [Rhodomicrobium udaipurense JA643]|uniref:Branched-chain amino acid ABC transporter permease n=1 Tax=Rhodomicrobium udaipurense TaxID=1202716 RepID=A0A8I1GAJ4_9HYPH|nr:branched-chain amino acid ABC transporter permease [Rhodomicrobium udaipurense]KAI93490.1 ABC transporter permease [Rhodomicrobium udaipurense JA643]MBJ7543543.1 branched-chain amino acid ABC transporter permease [Rhodomicrobium udaipurense]
MSLDQPRIIASQAIRPFKASPSFLHVALFAGLAAVLAILPLLGLYPFVLAQLLCFALFACAFNMLLGFVGLLSFGHAMFFGMASYVAAYTAKSGIAALPFWLPGVGRFDVPVGLPPFAPELAMLTGAAVAAVLGLIVGSLAIKRQGIYFAMITLALAQMVYFFSLQAPFTGGENGIQGVPRGHFLGFIDLRDDTTLYYVVAAIFFAGFLLIYRIIHSPFGQVLKAIRDNEPRAISLGYRTQRYKLTVFVLSAALAGLAGGMKAIVSQIATLSDVHWTMSGEVVLMTLVGGMGTIFGPVVGAVIVIAIQTYLNNLGAWVTIVQGTIFVICVMLFREGIVGRLSRWIKRPL